jgi:hypothetical protein
LGWFEFCKADYIAYGDAVNGTFYIIPLLELKEKVNRMPKQIAGCGKDSYGYLVPIKALSAITQTL